MRKVAAARDETNFNHLNATAEEWVPKVRRLRPDLPWEDLVRVINSQLPRGRPDWTVERLIRAVKRFVSNGLLEQVAFIWFHILRPGSSFGTLGV